MHLAITLMLLVTVVGLALWLRRTQNELRTVANYAPAAIAHVIGKGDRLKYLFANSTYAELYGREQKDVIGKHPKEILGVDIFGQAKVHMRRAIGGETVTFDLELGQKILQVTYFPDAVGSARPRGFVGVIADVTELRKLQRAVRT